MSVLTVSKKKVTPRVQVLSAGLATVAAVALPQLFHAVGAISGLGSMLGEAFLPMHLPILLVGFLAGPYAGAAAGLLAPLVSFALSGMPAAAMLPFMMLELCAYGVFAGLLQNKKMPAFGKLLLAQIAGRTVRAIAVLLAVYAVGYTGIAVSVIWMSVLKGLPGILLQWALLPLILFWLNTKKAHE